MQTIRRRCTGLEFAVRVPDCENPNEGKNGNAIETPAPLKNLRRLAMLQWELYFIISV
ncbi:MAG: hypothetical protein MK324_06025 [Pirellulales bacterium]|nr:hypothetical protein [Pirellulales bacterium]|tara:strand:- start:1038 stop:1211 length:174 start_codon:yes stop_codon:yes gene_type:complete